MPQGWAKCQREGHGCVKRRRVFGHAESIMLTGHSGQKPTIPGQHWIRHSRRFPLYPVTSSETTSFFPPRSPKLGSKRGRPTKRPALELKSGSAVDCLGFEHKPKRLKNACLPRRCWPKAGSALHLYLLASAGAGSGTSGTAGTAGTSGTAGTAGTSGTGGGVGTAGTAGTPAARVPVPAWTPVFAAPETRTPFEPTLLLTFAFPETPTRVRSDGEMVAALPLTCTPALPGTTARPSTTTPALPLPFAP